MVLEEADFGNVQIRHGSDQVRELPLSAEDRAHLHLQTNQVVEGGDLNSIARPGVDGVPATQLVEDVQIHGDLRVVPEEGRVPHEENHQDHDHDLVGIVEDFPPVATHRGKHRQEEEQVNGEEFHQNGGHDHVRRVEDVVLKIRPISDTHLALVVVPDLVPGVHPVVLLVVREPLQEGDDDVEEGHPEGKRADHAMNRHQRGLDMIQ